MLHLQCRRPTLSPAKPISMLRMLYCPCVQIHGNGAPWRSRNQNLDVLLRRGFFIFHDSFNEWFSRLFCERIYFLVRPESLQDGWYIKSRGRMEGVLHDYFNKINLRVVLSLPTVSLAKYIPEGTTRPLLSLLFHITLNSPTPSY